MGTLPLWSSLWGGEVAYTLWDSFCFPGFQCNYTCAQDQYPEELQHKVSFFKLNNSGWRGIDTQYGSVLRFKKMGCVAKWFITEDWTCPTSQALQQPSLPQGLKPCQLLDVNLIQSD